MRDFAGQQQFLSKPRHGRRTGGILGPDKLQRYRPAQLFVGGLVNGAHSAFAQQRFDAVARTEVHAGLQR